MAVLFFLTKKRQYQFDGHGSMMQETDCHHRQCRLPGEDGAGGCGALWGFNRAGKS